MERWRSERRGGVPLSPLARTFSSMYRFSRLSLVFLEGAMPWKRWQKERNCSLGVCLFVYFPIRCEGPGKWRALINKRGERREEGGAEQRS